MKSITEAHDGTLALTTRTEGGLGVTVQLPVAPPSLDGGRSSDPPANRQRTVPERAGVSEQTGT